MLNLNKLNLLLFVNLDNIIGSIITELSLYFANVIIIHKSNNKINKQDSNIKYYSFDIYSDECKLEEIFLKIINEFKTIDVLINAMEINHSKPFLKINQSDIENAFYVNYMLPIKMTQLYIRNIINSTKSGKIINICSMKTDEYIQNNMIYASSKISFQQMAKYLIREYKDYNIQINNLVPGIHLTPSIKNNNIDTNVKHMVLNRTPMKRMVKGNDLLGMIMLLASSMGNFINGADLVIDGGFSI